MGEFTKPVYLSKRAIKDLTKLKAFNKELFGGKKSKEIIDAIFERILILENPNTDFTKIGTIDNSFPHLKRTYRKLFEHHCKISYREGKTKIYVVRVFDMRQHPNKNK